MTTNRDLEKRLNRHAWVLTGIVLILVGMMRRVKIPLPEGLSFDFLPPLYSTFNAITALVLIVALVLIKQKKVEAHKKAMLVAVGFSVMFLLGYVLYHFTTPETIFGDINGDKILDEAEALAVGSTRTVYLIILATHIVLAAAIFPFILFTLIRAFTNQYDRHKKMARWVFPLWLYVAVTGPILYFMLMPYY